MRRLARRGPYVCAIFFSSSLSIIACKSSAPCGPVSETRNEDNAATTVCPGPCPPPNSSISACVRRVSIPSASIVDLPLAESPTKTTDPFFENRTY